VRSDWPKGVLGSGDVFLLLILQEGDFVRAVAATSRILRQRAANNATAPIVMIFNMG